MERWRPYVLGVYIVLTILVLGWEITGARHGQDRWPSITEIVVFYARQFWWVKLLLFTFLGWLIGHFIVRVFFNSSGGGGVF